MDVEEPTPDKRQKRKSQQVAALSPTHCSSSSNASASILYECVAVDANAMDASTTDAAITLGYVTATTLSLSRGLAILCAEQGGATRGGTIPAELGESKSVGEEGSEWTHRSKHEESGEEAL